MTRRLARFDNGGRELSDASSRARVDSIDRSSYAEEHSAFALTPPPSAERFPDTFCIHAAKGDRGVCLVQGRTRVQFRRLIAEVNHRPRGPDCPRGTLLCPASFVFLKREKESIREMLVSLGF